MFVVFLFLVIITLVLYTLVFSRVIAKKGAVTDLEKLWLGLGLVFDCVATFLMASASHQGATIHAVLGYLALVFVIIWFIMLAYTCHVQTERRRWHKRLVNFSYIAYPFWMLIFFFSAIAKRG